jgi:hypothetical protein
LTPVARFARLLLLPSLLAAVVSCEHPKVDAGDCTKAHDAVARENCLFEAASAAWKRGVPAFRKSVKAIPSPESRDLVRLRIAIDDPAGAAQLCAEVETEPAREKCRQVLGRPHLRTRPKEPEAPTSDAMPPPPPAQVQP